MKFIVLGLTIISLKTFAGSCDISFIPMGVLLQVGESDTRFFHEIKESGWEMRNLREEGICPKVPSTICSVVQVWDKNFQLSLVDKNTYQESVKKFTSKEAADKEIEALASAGLCRVETYFKSCEIKGTTLHLETHLFRSERSFGSVDLAHQYLKNEVEKRNCPPSVNTVECKYGISDEGLSVYMNSSATYVGYSEEATTLMQRLVDNKLCQQAVASLDCKISKESWGFTIRTEKLSFNSRETLEEAQEILNQLVKDKICKSAAVPTIN